MTSKLKAKGADHATVINRAIENAKQGTILSFPYDSQVDLTSSIIQDNKAIIWEGNNSLFKVWHKESGFIITRRSSIKRIRMMDMEISNGLNDHDNKEQHGIDCSAPINTYGIVAISGFYGHGLKLWASTESRPGSDVSNSKFESLLVQSCRGDGVHIQGADANQIIFYHLDVRDNWGWGYHDDSFLGCKVIEGMAHNNRLGHYRVSQGTSMAKVSGYGEGDSPPSVFFGSTVVEGGHWNGVELHDNATYIRGREMKAFKSASIEIIEGDGITFGKPKVTNGLNLNLVKDKGKNETFAHYGMTHTEGEFWSFFGGSAKYPADYAGRKIPFASSGFQHLFIGDRLFITGEKDLVIKLSNGFEFKNGDTIFNSKFDGTNAERYVFVNKDWKEVKI